jgi:hypothetical protein
MPSAHALAPADRCRGARPRGFFCYSVQALPEVGIIARLLEICAKRGLLPTRLHSDLAPERGALIIDMQLAGIDPAYGEQMACSMREVVGVLEVLTAEKSAVEPLALSA